MRPRDTTADSHAVQLEVYRRMGSAGRANLAARLSGDTRRLVQDGIRSRHPAYSDEEVALAFRRLLYGDDLFHRAWPGRPLLAP